MRLAAALVLVSCASTREVPRAIRFETLPYTLAPGEEKYFCYTMTLPADRETAIAAFRPTQGKLVHHLVLSYTLANEPDGFSECPVRFKDTWVPLFESGRESGSLTMPPGAAVRFRGQQLLMQLHLVNATRAPITETSAIAMESMDAPVVSAGLFGFDNRVFAIPPKSMGTAASMSCTMTRDMDVFAVLGHMHGRGSHLELKRGDEVLFQTQWNFDVQPTTPLQLKVKKGDTLDFRCTWNNESDATIQYGDRAEDEMCSLIWYYIPYDRPDGCAKLE